MLPDPDQPGEEIPAVEPAETSEELSEEPTDQPDEPDVTDEELLSTQAENADAAPDAPAADAAGESLPAETELPEAESGGEPEETDEPPKELPPETLAFCRSAVEAILFSQAEPVTTRKMAEALDIRGADSRTIRKITLDLAAEYQNGNRGFAIEELAGGFQLLTRPDFADCISRLGVGPGATKLSQAALETLAVVAYKQPVTRADIEAIRGVQAGPLLRTLLQKRLVRITGRAEILGRPLLYGTTKEFLEYFGLKSLNELPKVEELPRP